MKKVLSVLLLTGVFFTTTAGSVFAAESSLPYIENLGYEVDVIEESDDIVLYRYDSGWKNFLGGSWRHGVNNKQVWSKFDHNRKVHKTTVKGAGGKY